MCFCTKLFLTKCEPMINLHVTATQWNLVNTNIVKAKHPLNTNYLETSKCYTTCIIYIIYTVSVRVNS